MYSGCLLTTKTRKTHLVRGLMMLWQQGAIIHHILPLSLSLSLSLTHTHTHTYTHTHTPAQYFRPGLMNACTYHAGLFRLMNGSTYFFHLLLNGYCCCRTKAHNFHLLNCHPWPSYIQVSVESWNTTCARIGSRGRKLPPPVHHVSKEEQYGYNWSCMGLLRYS